MQWLELIGGIVVAAFLVIGIVRYFSATVPWTPTGIKGDGTTPPWPIPPDPYAPKQPQEKDSTNAPQ